MAWWVWGGAQGLNQRAQSLMAADNGIMLEAQNINFAHDGALVQRFGAVRQALTGFPGSIEWLGRFSRDNGSEELFWFAIDTGGVVHLVREEFEMAVSDPATADHLIYAHAATLNDKFFITYDSNVNRLHVWDGTQLRRVGFNGIVPPVTVAAGAVGTISKTRWYRKRMTQYQTGTSKILRRSEPSAAVSLAITSKVGWVISRGAVPGAGETHWELEEADLEEGPWYLFSTQLLTTMTVDDFNVDLFTLFLSDLIGAHMPPPSAKYILSDGNRLVMAGCWETTAQPGEIDPHQNRIWYTPVLGTSDEGDDERIPDTEDQQNFIDVGDEGPITGLAGPLYGDIYVFKTRSIWKLVPLEDFTLPFRAVLVTDVLGCIDQRVIASGEAPNGTPAIYFASADSVTRISQGGIQDLSEPISRDLQFANLTPPTSLVAFDPASHTIYLQTNVGSSVVPGQYFAFAFDIKKERWAGTVIGEGGAGWILGRTVLGTPRLLGPLGMVIKTATIAHNDDGHERLLFGGQDENLETVLVSLGDQCGVDDTHPYDSIVRIRKLATPGHLFSCGAPTVIYRCPSTPAETVGTLTVGLIRDDGVEMVEDHIMVPTDQDNPIQLQRHTFTGLQTGDVSSIDVRLRLRFTHAYHSTIPASIDALLIPIEQKDMYAR